MKNYRPFLLAFLITAGCGVLALAGLLLAGAAGWLARPQPPGNQAPARSVTVTQPVTATIIPLPATWTPTWTYRPNPTRTQAPTWTAQVTPTEANTWRWEDMESVGLRVNLPKSWSMDGYIVAHACEQFTVMLTQYIITSPAWDYLEVDVMCPPIYHSRLGPCYAPVILDEPRQIYRQTLLLPLVNYSGYYFDKGKMQCTSIGWPVGDKYIIGAYYNRRTFEPDYAVVDRIMLSIKTR